MQKRISSILSQSACKVKETLKLKGRTYDNLTLGVVPKLCADIVLGQAFMRQHEEVVFKLGGSKKGLVVAHCGVAASRVHTQETFSQSYPRMSTDSYEITQI